MENFGNGTGEKFLKKHLTNQAIYDIIYIVKERQQNMAIKIIKSEPKSKRHLQFGELKIGDIFLLGSEVFIKIDQFYGDCGEPDHNCINLKDGVDYQIDDNECVSKFLKDIEITYTNEDIQSWI